jgi:hypothetical protein
VPLQHLNQLTDFHEPWNELRAIATARFKFPAISNNDVVDV